MANRLFRGLLMAVLTTWLAGCGGMGGDDPVTGITASNFEYGQMATLTLTGNALDNAITVTSDKCSLLSLGNATSPKTRQALCLVSGTGAAFFTVRSSAGYVVYTTTLQIPEPVIAITASNVAFGQQATVTASGTAVAFGAALASGSSYTTTVNADGRALVTLGSSGHTHSVPSCAAISADRVCLDGTARLLSLAARWTPRNSPFHAYGEWWAKQEDGRLDSIHGAPDYTGKLNGGWLDLGWRLAPAWETIARVERSVARHDLVGANAALVASQAGIADSARALGSTGVVLLWRPAEGHRLAAEWHRERSESAPNTIYLLRYQMALSRGLF